MRAAAETYIGLVEFGAGVIPAGGGCLGLWRNFVESIPEAVAERIEATGDPAEGEAGYDPVTLLHPGHRATSG